MIRSTSRHQGNAAPAIGIAAEGEGANGTKGGRFGDGIHAQLQLCVTHLQEAKGQEEAFSRSGKSQVGLNSRQDSGFG